MSLTEHAPATGRNCGLIPCSYTCGKAGTCAPKGRSSTEIELQGDAVGVVHEQLPKPDAWHVVDGIGEATDLELGLHLVVVVAFEGDMVDRAAAVQRLHIQVARQRAQ